MKKVALVFSLMICTSTFIYSQNVNGNVMKSFRITADWPIYIPGLPVKDDKSSTNVIFDDKYWIITKPVRLAIEELEAAKKGSDKVEFGKTELMFTVGRRNFKSGFGYLRDKLDQPIISLDVDSMVNYFLDIPSMFYPLLADADSNPGILVRNKGIGFIEIVNFPSASAESPDTIKYYYDDNASTGFRNISQRVLDKRLYRFEAVFLEKSLSNGTKSPARNWKFEINDVEVPERELMEKLILQFKKDSEKLLLKKIN